MIKRLANKIERKRNSESFFWKISIKIKDFLWVHLFKEILFRPTLEWNRCWNIYHWKENGDEWKEPANFCSKPYDEWKTSIVDIFIKPNIDKEAVVLEIAPGHGRWMEFLLKKAKKVILVDLNSSCIDFCKNKFSKFKDTEYYVNDGKKLSFIDDKSVDFIWSWDSFVHMEKEVVDSYFQEFSRILKPKGKAIIHHSGNKIPKPILFLMRMGLIGRVFHKLLYSKKVDIRGGRSSVSGNVIKKLVARSNLIMDFQIDSWGKNDEYNCKLYGDLVSKLRKE